MISAQAVIELFAYALANAWGYIWGQYGQMWTQAKQAAKVQYMVSKYGSGWKSDAAAKSDNYYYSAYYGGQWVGHNVADCSGLFRWAIEKLGGKISHSSNRIWQSYCSSRGELENGKRKDGKELKIGTAVFVHKSGTTNRSHIGLYVGDGRVIEAQGTKAGVVESRITDKKWIEWGELSMIDYSGEVQPTPEPDPVPDPIPDPSEKPTIRKGSTGAYVTLLQTQLIQRGYPLPRYGADGKFGDETAATLKEFQRDNGLEADGVCGPRTWKAFEDTEPTKLYTVTIQHLPLYKAQALISAYDGCSYMTQEEG